MKSIILRFIKQISAKNKISTNVIDNIIKEKELAFQIYEIIKKLSPRYSLRESIVIVETLTDIPLEILENQYMKIPPIIDET